MGINPRIVLMVLTVMVVTAPIASASVLDESVSYLSTAPGYVDNVRESSLLLMALASIYGKAKNQSTIESSLLKLINYLKTAQNPDGGWGYYPGEISNPLDTGYALAALGTAKKLPIEGLDVSSEVREGVGYLMNSFNGQGWGYTPNTPPDPYITAVALWGLGANGYSIKNPKVSGAVSYLESFNETSPEILALKLIAYHYVGYKNVSGLIERAYEILSGEPSPSERAMLTYALTLYPESMTSELTRSLVILERTGSRNGTFALTQPIWPLPELDSVTPTSFAVMAFAALSEVTPKLEYPTFSQMCDYLLSVQNPDGGWGYKPGDFSQAKPTYYALEALSLCAPRPVNAIKRGTAWAENHLNSAMEEVRRRGMLTQDFYYTALMLSKYSNLTPSDRESLIGFINAYRYSTFAWRGYFAIPQPAQTAMGISLLKALNVTNLTTPAEWLLSLTDKGWGLLINYPFPIMSSPDVPTTLLVLEALTGTVSEDKLKPHLDWLLAQRLENGFWGQYKRSVNIFGEVSTAPPSIEYTVRALELLRKYGYELNYFKMAGELLLKAGKSNRTVDKALAFKFALESGFLPPILLSSVAEKLGEGTWYVHYNSTYSIAAERVSEVIKSLGGVPILKEGELGRESIGNHVFIGPLGSFNVRVYNPHVNVSVSESYVEVNGRRYSKTGLVLIIPGRTQDGYVLLLMADKKVLPSIDLIINPTMMRYLHGAYVVFSVKDSNGDGKITPNEVKILFQG